MNRTPRRRRLTTGLAVGIALATIWPAVLPAGAAPDDRRPGAGRADLVLDPGEANQPRVRADASTARVPMAQRTWLDDGPTPGSRARALLEQMTLEEKADLMTSETGPYAYHNAPIDRLGIPALKMADGTAGIGPRGWMNPGTGDTATAMPTTLALAASFDPDLAAEFGTLVAGEARATGHNVLLGPNADIIRQPWWGRESETMSEDPFLTAEMTTPYVKASQAEGLITTMKHYALYNQETNRANGQNTTVSDRAAHEVHLPPYEKAISEADLSGVMCSFNKIDSVYACENPDAINGWLRGQLGFDGFVLSDFGAVHSTVPTVRAGTDFEAGTQAFFGSRLVDAVNDGQLQEFDLDAACLRILETMFRIGLFDGDYEPTPLPVAQNGAVARRVEEQAITLLKNDANALPLRPAGLNSIAVIGGDANIALAQSGAPYVKPTYSVSPLQGIQDYAGSRGIGVTYTPGTDPVNGASMLGGFPAVPSAVLTPESGAGPGLTTDFWQTVDRSGPPTVTRVERQVNYDVALLSSSDGLRSSQVAPPPAANTQSQGAANYRGTLTAPTTGTYQFSLSGWGSATMTLGGNQVIDMTGVAGYRTVTSDPITLTAGQAYPVVVDYTADQPLATIDGGALKLGWSHPQSAVSPAITAAANAAAAASTAVVVVSNYESEQRDRADLTLQNEQDALIAAVTAANPNTVVVLQTGGPVTMPWLGSVKSVLQTYYGGQEVGGALARVLFGEVNPQGRLPLTYPRSVADVPVDSPTDAILNAGGVGNLDVDYDEGIFVGYRAYDQLGRSPLFSFGHGLSYTSFGYSGLEVTPTDTGLSASFTVTNTGSVAGTETPQVYIGAPSNSPVEMPVRSLVGFDKVTLDPGQARKITIPVDTRELSYWSTNAQDWRLASGARSLWVGASSTDLRLSKADATVGVFSPTFSRAPDKNGWYTSPVTVSGQLSVLGGGATCTTVTVGAPDSPARRATVTCTDPGGAATTHDVVLKYDATDPGVSITSPRKPARASSWRTVRGTATADTGSPITSVELTAVQKRARGWFSYTNGDWKKAPSKRAALRRATELPAALGGSGWRVKVKGIKRGQLVVRVLAAEEAGHTAQDTLQQRVKK